MPRYVLQHELSGSIEGIYVSIRDVQIISPTGIEIVIWPEHVVTSRPGWADYLASQGNTFALALIGPHASEAVAALDRAKGGWTWSHIKAIYTDSDQYKVPSYIPLHRIDRTQMSAPGDINERLASVEAKLDRLLKHLLPAPPPLPPPPPPPKRQKRRLNIFNYIWHTGHQYELHKLPHNWILASTDTTATWNYSWRPMQPNVKIIPFHQINMDDIDLAILHIDENIAERGGGTIGGHWGKDSVRYIRELPCPKIIICHGMPPRIYRCCAEKDVDNYKRWIIDGVSYRKILELIGNNMVVCNSITAATEWGFPRHRVIIHGFDPSEYPLGKRQGGAISATDDLSHRAYYRGADIFRQITARVPITLLGRDTTYTYRTTYLSLPNTASEGTRNFQRYIDFLGQHLVYVHHTRLSPNPRARAEAVLCGLALVTTDYHGESEQFEHGKEAYISNDPAELAEAVEHLLRHPDLAREMGERGRQKAQQIWHISRYQQDWYNLMREVLATDPASRTELV